MTRTTIAPRLIRMVLVLSFTLAALLYVAAIGSRAMEPAAPASVAHQDVCMVTDRVLARPQIPVEFEGKTYYGCCMGCVARLKGDRSLRYATDPVTGTEVDKAVAFIAAGPGGEALYFESEKTAAAFTLPAAGQPPLAEEQK